MEHSGTSLTARQMTAHPQVNAAFECAVLLADSPADIPKLDPWAKWFVAPMEKAHWGLTPEQLEEVAASRDWQEVYSKLIQLSPIFQDGETMIIDKCPRYLLRLSDVLAKVPGTPCFVLQKDVLLLYYSYKKRGHELKNFVHVFNRCQEELVKAEANFDVHRVSQLRLYNERPKVFAELCAGSGLAFEERYASEEWCREHMAPYNFHRVFVHQFDLEAALAKARGLITDEELAVLRGELNREGAEEFFEHLDA